MTNPRKLPPTDLDRWAYDDELEAKAIARATEPDIDPDRD